MTAALIADNHLALEPLLRARLAVNLSDVSVGGFLDWLDLLNGQSTAVPAVFVVYDGDRLSSGAGSPHQSIVGQVWQVVIVTPATTALDGTLDMAPTGALMATVIRALSGVRLDATLKPMVRLDDADPMRHGNGLLFAFLTFSQPIDMR